MNVETLNQKYLDLEKEIRQHLINLLGKTGGNFDFEAINQEFDDAGDNTITAIDVNCVYAEDKQGEEIDYPLGALTPTETLHAAYVIENHLKESGEEIDLLANYHLLPLEVQNILHSFDENKDSYKECERISQELKPHGYTVDWDLSGTLYDLEKIE